MDERERRWEYLYGAEAGRLIAAEPIGWLPLGVLEHHGEHLPWGLDGLKAHAICMRLAARIGGVVLPASHYAGIHGDEYVGGESPLRKHAEAGGDLLYREQTLRAYLDDTFDSLASLGLRVIVAYTGHYPAAQKDVLREATSDFNSRCSAAAIPFWEPIACGEGDHGGKWETSLYMAVAPGCVRLDSICEDGTGESGVYRGQDVRANATREFGEQGLRRIEAYLSRAVAAALAGMSRTDPSRETDFPGSGDP